MNAKLVEQLVSELSALLQLQATKGESETQQTKTTSAISDKQRKYIFALANRAGLGKEALNRLIKQLTGKDSLDWCSKEEASSVIDTLNEVVKKKEAKEE